MFNDASYTERMIKNFNLVVHLNPLRLGEEIVHQDIIRALERTTGKIMEAAGKLLKTFQVNAV